MKNSARPKKNNTVSQAVERTRLRLADLQVGMSADLGLDQAKSTKPVLPINSGTDKKRQSKTYRIVFYPSRETLGSKGRSQALNLLAFIKNADKITVRGILIEDEFRLTGDARSVERRSVGRSLTVREFWRKRGADVSAVTILHYSRDTPGRYVEVIIHG